WVRVAVRNVSRPSAESPSGVSVVTKTYSPGSNQSSGIQLTPWPSGWSTRMPECPPETEPSTRTSARARRSRPRKEIVVSVEAVREPCCGDVANRVGGDTGSMTGDATGVASTCALAWPILVAAIAPAAVPWINARRDTRALSSVSRCRVADRFNEVPPWFRETPGHRRSRRARKIPGLHVQRDDHSKRPVPDGETATRHV